MDWESGNPGGPKIEYFRSEIRIFRPKPRGGSCADLPRSSGIISSPENQHPTMFVNDFHKKKNHRLFKTFFLKNDPSGNHENTTFRASLEPEGPRDRACGKEREILCKIALMRALYDPMAPQLCHFHVPGKLRSFSSFCF